MARATTRVFLQLQPPLLSDVSICTSDHHASLPSIFIASPICGNPESAAELPIELVIHITEPRGGPGRTHATVSRIRHGFDIEAIREPMPDEAVVAERPDEERWRRIPNFLMVRACLK
jgi:hypothetical protein